jgi:hypothetical protein
MIVFGQPAFPCLFDQLRAEYDGFAWGIHTDSNLTTANLQNRYGDVVSDCERLCWASSQNEHSPLPPGVATFFTSA